MAQKLLSAFIYEVFVNFQPVYQGLWIMKTLNDSYGLIIFDEALKISLDW